ncbi:MAG: uroporphyrinogen-III synthase [archaeon]|nr:uroporphyrinogen-III synthase [archaeon]
MRTLVFTRPSRRLKESIEQAERSNFNVIAAPSLDIIHGKKDQYLDIEKRLVDGLYKMAIFSSSTAVEECFTEWEDKFASLFSGVDVVAIGPKTRSSLLSHGIETSLMPSEYTSSGLVSCMGRYENEKVLIVHSDKGSPVLKNGLIDLGFSVDELIAYSLESHKGDVDDIRKAVVSGVVDVFAFTSKMSVKSFADAMEMPLKQVFSNAVVAAIGEPTKTELEDRGIHVNIIPMRATFDELLKSITEYFDKNSGDF